MEKSEPELEDINIFSYHPHMKSRVKTIKSNSDSAESGQEDAESELLVSAESKQGDINMESTINIDDSGQGETEKDANVKKTGILLDTETRTRT